MFTPEDAEAIARSRAKAITLRLPVHEARTPDGQRCWKVPSTRSSDEYTIWHGPDEQYACSCVASSPPYGGWKPRASCVHIESVKLYLDHERHLAIRRAQARERRERQREVH